MVALVIALLLVAVFAIAMLVFVGYERGPAPADVAVAYALALERHDFSTLFDLSVPELRGTKVRRDFEAARRVEALDVPESLESIPRVVEMSMDDAGATVLIEIDRGTASSFQKVSCVRRSGRWQVIQFENETTG